MNGLNKQYTLINCYRIHKIGLDKEALNDIIRKNENCILTGDLNTGAENNANTKLNQETLEYITETGLYDTNTENNHTNVFRWLSDKPTLSKIDYILTSHNIRPEIQKFEILEEYVTTANNFHYPIEVTLADIIPTAREPSRNFKKLNKKAYQKHIHTHLNKPENAEPELNSTEAIDKAVAIIKNGINFALDKDIPIKKHDEKKHKYISKETKKLIKEKKGAMKRYKHDKKNKNIDPNIIKEIKTHINYLGNKIKEQGQKEREEKWLKDRDKAFSQPVNSTEFWRSVNYLTGIKKGRRAQKALKYTNTKDDNMTGNTDESRANIHLAYQETVFKETDINTPETREYWKNVVEPNIKFLKDELPERENTDFKEITKADITKALKTTAPHKAPGDDGIKPICLKWATPQMRERLRQIFNACLTLNYHPLSWKQAIIILFPKPNKDHTDPSGYRPISLLESIAKLFEKIMATRLAEKLEILGYFPKFQSGFRKKRGTTDNLFKLVNSTMNSLKRSKKSGQLIVALDVEKAFDKASHEALLTPLIKLYKEGKIPKYLVLFYENFLKDRSFKVRDGNHTTTQKGKITAGVPQGSCSAPILYILFTADAPTPPTFIEEYSQNTRNKLDDNELGALNSMKVNTGVKYMRGGALHYADDIVEHQEINFEPDERTRGNVAYSLPIKRTQSFLDETVRHCNERKIQLNVKKTQFLICRHRRSDDTCKNIELTMYGKKLKQSETLTYLGIEFDKRMNLAKHSKEVENRCKARMSMIRKVTKDTNVRPQKIMHMMQALVFSIMQYGATAWLNTKTQPKMIAKIYKLARQIAVGGGPGLTSKYIDPILGEPMDPLDWITGINARWYEKCGNRPDILESIEQNYKLRHQRKVDKAPYRKVLPITPIQQYHMNHPPRYRRRQMPRAERRRDNLRPAR